MAGKLVTNAGVREWIRPISSSPTHEISQDQRRYADGSDAAVMDLVEIGFLKHVPTAHQSENHLIASRTWRKTGTATWSQLQTAVDSTSSPLWVNGHSTMHGTNDKVPEANLLLLADSLKLVNVESLRLIVAREAGYQGRAGARKVRASFLLNDVRYRLAVTDPIFEAEYLAKPDGAYPIGPATLCISLSEPKYGFGFKLIATILLKNRC